MSNVPATQVFVSGVPIEYIAASEIHLCRGTQPWEWRFLTSDPEKFRNLSNPVQIKIITPDTTSIGVKELVLKNWFITEIIPHSTQTWEVVVQDVRWRLGFKKCGLSFNQKTVDGQYRTDTLKGGQRWKAVEAIKRAIEEFGGTVVLDPSLSQIQQGQVTRADNVILPDNMGNSQAGGWFAASFSECLDQMLEVVPLDIVPDAEGRLVLTDRYTNRTANLDQAGAYGGIAGPKINKWQMPSSLSLIFEQRIERIFRFNEGAQTSASALYDYTIENVVPVPNNVQGFDDSVKYESFTTFLNRVGVSPAQWRERYFKDTVVPEGAALTDQMLFDARSYEALGRSHYRLTFKVQLQAQAMRVWSKIALGRLGKDGKTSPGSSVFNDWVEVVLFSWRDPQKDPRDLDSHKFSKNHTVPSMADIVAGRVAAVECPYRAAWISDGKTDLVFTLTEKGLPTKIREIIPGKAEKPISYGDSPDIINDQGDIILERRGKLTTDYQAIIFWHGILNTDFAGFTSRYYTINKTFHASGVVPVLELRAEELTANWRYDPDNPSKPGTLLNAAELDELYERVKDRFLADYKQGIAGVMNCFGIETLVAGYWTGGNIHDVIIRIGEEARFTVNTTFVIMPSVRKYFGLDARDGQPAEYIE